MVFNFRPNIIDLLHRDYYLITKLKFNYVDVQNLSHVEKMIYLGKFIEEQETINKELDNKLPSLDSISNNFEI